MTNDSIIRSLDAFLTVLETNTLEDVSDIARKLCHSWIAADKRWGTGDSRTRKLEALWIAANLKRHAMRLRAKGNIARATKCEQGSEREARTGYTKRRRAS